jgi:hypothetical protein
MSENDFECFASTGVNTLVTVFPNSEDAKIKFLEVNVRTAWTEAPHLAGFLRAARPGGRSLRPTI